MMNDAEPRIAYLLHRFPGHTDTFIKREIKALLKHGRQVQVLSVWKPKDNETTPAHLEEWQGVTTFLLPKGLIGIAVDLFKVFAASPGRFFSGLGLAWKTSRLGLKGLMAQGAYFIQAVLACAEINKHGYTHLHNHIGDQSGTVTMLAARLAGIGYSITFHGWPVFFDAEKHRVSEKVKAAAFTRSISYFCRSQLMLFSGATDPTPFKVVHCGIELSAYKFRMPRQDVRRVLCVARISPEKGLTFLIEAFKKLADSGLNCELRLAGDGSMRADLEAMARNLGIADKVTFLGFINEAQIAQELQLADIFVLTSYVEGVPVSAMEAMAVGVPVVATNVGGTSELIQDGVSGLLVRPSDTETIYASIRKLIENPDLRSQIAKNGRLIVEKEFDSEPEFAKLSQYFLEYGHRAVTSSR